MSTPKNALQVELNAAIQRHFDSRKAESLCRVVAPLAPDPELWTARGIKARLADVLDNAGQGMPQLVKRANDELPVLVISLESLGMMAEELIHEPQPVSFWSMVKDDLQPVEQVTLELCDTPTEHLGLALRNEASTVMAEF